MSSEPVALNNPTKHDEPLVTASEALDAFAKTADSDYRGLDFKSYKPIPDTFIQLGVCAIRFDNFDMPECFGCQSNCQICCIQTNSLICKPITNHARVQAICTEDVCEIVDCNFDSCKCYRQCCCIELVCGFPLEESYVVFPLNPKEPLKFSRANAANMYPCSGMCCTVNSCFGLFPDCIGCAGKGFCLFCEAEDNSCKPYFLNDNRANQNLLCVCTKRSCQIVDFEMYCKQENQMCCLDQRCALPCDADVPCLCMPLPFMTLLVNFDFFFGCGLTLQEIYDFQAAQGNAITAPAGMGPSNNASNNNAGNANSNNTGYQSPPPVTSQPNKAAPVTSPLVPEGHVVN